MKKQGKKANQITIAGVTIRWSDTRRMVRTEPDDMEMLGEFKVSLSAVDANVHAMENAMICAKTLRKAADEADMFCPHSNSRLRAIGLNAIGSVMLQIYRGDRTCDAIAVIDMAQMDPANYSGGGEEAMKSIAWMRDVARAIAQYHDALCGHGAIDLEGFHEAVRGGYEVKSVA